jgi:hypothetical protein
LFSTCVYSADYALTKAPDILLALQLGALHPPHEDCGEQEHATDEY